VGKIARLAAAEREAALSRLLILAGLRRLEETVAREIQKMPVYIDILENKVLGPPYKKGLEEGRQEGIQEGIREGRQEGMREGELAILRRLIEKRFGAIPSWAEQRLAGRSTVELEDLSVRALDAQSIEDLLR
jgi:predicted transposase YdaD